MGGWKKAQVGENKASGKAGPGFAGQVERFHRIVFAWYAEHGRDLPWRRTTDPYAIALSEIMLQQTQVDRVIPKWRAFLHAFPTWADLAAANTADVLRLWKGLGYNRRAVMLHRLAEEVGARRKLLDASGELPNDIAALKKLPGIGEYTANAIAAFAFRNPDAAPVDTNIIRILRRVFPRHRADARSMQALAYSIRPTDVWTWNHALMDLGALHCSARTHIPALCPLAPLHGTKDRTVNPPPAKGESEGVSRRKATMTLKFEDTDRFYRGRIVDQLREGPITIRKLRSLSVFTRIDDERFTTLLKGVVHDGLIEVHRSTVFLMGDRPGSRHRKSQR